MVITVSGDFVMTQDIILCVDKDACFDVTLNAENYDLKNVSIKNGSSFI